MHRNLLITLLKSYKNNSLITHEEQTMFEHTWKFVNTVPNCFERSNLYGHVTGSAFIVDASGTQTLLMHHKKLNIWVQLGGHADGDHDVCRVANKEAEEESGITNFTLLSPQIYDLDVHVIPERKMEPEHFHFDIRFLFQAPKDAQPIQNEESNKICWVPFDTVQKLTTERSVLRLVEKWKLLKQ